MELEVGKMLGDGYVGSDNLTEALRVL